jgi:SEC-C motif-containing protein
MKNCPCCSNKAYSECCAQFILGKQTPATPEELMRSRYTAYTQANIDYIVNTMKSPAADNYDYNSAYEWAKKVKWNRLKVINVSMNQTIGFVEFYAYFYENHQQQIIHENSEFHLVDGKWFYIDGSLKK